MIAFQRRNLSLCFLIGGTIVFSVLLSLILETTPFASFTTKSSNGVPCCNLLHGNADKLQRIHELRNESISHAASLHDVLQKYRAWETNFYLRDELRNKFEVAWDDFHRRYAIILRESVVVAAEIDAMEREFMECVTDSTRTRAVALIIRCGWPMVREFGEMKVLIRQVLEILLKTMERGRNLDWEYSTPKGGFLR